MSIRFSCKCGRKLRVSDEKIGMKVLCASCGETLRVPKKSQDEYWQDVPVKSDEATVDYVGALKDFLIQFVPGATVLVLLVWFAYFLSSQVIVGRGNIPDLGRVHGTIKLDGNPLPNAAVRFIALDPDTNKERKGASVSLGLTDDKGEYNLLYVVDHPGAAVGLNRVEIEAKDANGSERLPTKYNARSTLTADVKSGSNEFPFDVESNHPPGSGTGTQPTNP